MASTRFGKLALALGTVSVLAACQNGTQPFSFLKNKPVEAAPADATASAAPQESSVKLVDRDVEAPEVFQKSELALWDGRPSLGGVWVAYPGVKDPERVIIRNPANGKFVIGALFRREIDNPGPKLQLSSDAASALGLLAGQPGKISVTALRREEKPAPVPDAKKPLLDGAEGITSKPLADVASVAGKAIDKADAKGAKASKAPPPKPVPAPATPAKTPAAAAPAVPSVAPSAAPAGAADHSMLQIGIFSVEANAKRVAKSLSKAGAKSSIVKDESQGKSFWRVLVGPADTPDARDALLKKVKGLGYADAYFVSK